jgi:signal transduction histidine kinase
VRLRATILTKLLLAFALPTVVLFVAFAWVAHEVARRDLDEELGTRLAAIAASSATQVRGKYLSELSSGDEDERAYLNVLAKLEQVAKATGVRLYVFDRQFNSRVDTEPGVAIGTHYYPAELDRLELERVFAAGDSIASVSFQGSDGRRYKAGYAAVRASETEPEIVLAIGAQAPAAYFDRLHQLRASLLLWGAALMMVVLAATVAAAFLMTRKLRQLAGAAARMGSGDLTAPIDVKSNDEIGVLAATMERMRGQLAERDLHMQQMLAGIAHEVRNPLAGMTLFTGILREELPADDERRGHVDKIARELGYLGRVVDDFLDYARRARPDPGEVDLMGLASEVAQLTRTDAISVGVQLEVERVWADRSQLRRALLNLAQNAVQAAERAGETGEAVRIFATASKAQVVLEVSNRGAVIPAELQAKIFQPFFTTREKGTGLGLSFVKETVLAHGGTITVDSDAASTRFRIALPRR